MRERLPQHRHSSWDDLTPSKHMFMGIGLMILTSIGVGVFIAVTIWFILTIGFLQTVTMYGALTFITTFYLIYTRHRRHRIGFSTVRTWDTDAADQSGSTARYGTPHDPYSFIPEQSMTRKRRNPPRLED